jgi:hypothetical protein
LAADRETLVEVAVGRRVEVVAVGTRVEAEEAATVVIGSSLADFT